MVIVQSVEPASPTLPAVHEAWLPRQHSLHRPRHGRRQTAALVCAAVFFAAPTALWVGGLRPTEIENHPLAGFPNPNEGWAFFTGLPDWADDNLSFRPAAVRFTDWFSRSVFGEPPPFTYGERETSGPLLEPEPPKPVEDREAPGDDPNQPDFRGFARVIEGTDGWMYFGMDVAAKCEPGRPLAEISQQVGKLRRAVEDSGRRFVLVVVPDKTTMVTKHLPDSYPGRKCAAEASEKFWAEVERTPGVVDIRSELADVGGLIGDPPYFPQDSHWTHEGAMVMVKRLAETVRPGVTTTWRSTPAGSYSGPADLPPLIGRKGEKVGRSYTLAPDGLTNRSRPSTFNLNRPVRFATEPLDGVIDQPTAVLGDSFGIAASSYLPAAFSDLTMVDYSSFGADQAGMIETMADAEVVVFEIVERNLAAGRLPMLKNSVIDGIRTGLAQRPVR